MLASDDLFARAADAVSRGAPLDALVLVGRDETARGLTLRGIAYAQMGDFDLAQTCLERARAMSLTQTRPSNADAIVAARARAALVEIALSTGDPGPAAREATEVAEELLRLGDGPNAAMQRLVLARAEVLLGRLDEARRIVLGVLATELPPTVRAIAWLARAEVAIRAVAPTEARAALAEARHAQSHAPNVALLRALDAIDNELTRPLARIVHAGTVRAASLFDIEAATRGDALFVDACRGILVSGRVTVPLARRPVLLTLVLALAQAYPAAVPRDDLAVRAFGLRATAPVNASHRARLRVEIGRLRKLMEGLGAAPKAAPEGYALDAPGDVKVLLAPTDDGAARIELLLADGAAWSAQSLAEHARVSRRTAQRALVALAARGGAVRTGSARDLRYTRPGAPVASRMLLLGLVPAT